ncbi:MAG: hydantoinase B/oxoprolinase family protein [Bdellovibrionota bacterium]
MNNNLNFIPQFFSELVSLAPRFAVLNRELQTLHVQSHRPEDLITLPLAATQAMHFFNLKEGDLILLNDPSCGGLGPGDLTWITLVQGLVISFRKSHPTSWTTSLKREDEGLRIPPTPLRMDGVINTSILDILCQQGIASCRYKDFKNLILESIELSQIISERVSRALNHQAVILDKNKQKNYFESSRKYFLKKFLDRIHGETRIELPLRTGETLKLKVSCEEVGLKIDLSGTTQGQKLFIPESWTQSAVIAFVMNQVNETELFNQGSFSAINLFKPQQSFLSSKSQNSLSSAQHLGLPTIWSALHFAFYDLLPKSMPAPHDYFPLQLQWHNDESTHEFILPSGTGAFRDKESWPGYLLNRDTPLDLGVFSRSNNFEFLDLHERKLSSQRTSLNGGPGWSLKLKARSDSQIHWFGNNLKFPWKFSKTLIAIEPGEILINGEARDEVIGKADLKADDELILNSGQGAGFVA